jgi:subtilisin family serine protease
MDVPRPRPDGERPKPTGDRDLTDRRPVFPPLSRMPATADPVISVPPEILARYNARVLDPPTSAKVRDEPAIRSTVYIGDSLLVTASAADEDDFFTLLRDAAQTKNLTFDQPSNDDPAWNRLAALAIESRREDAQTLFPRVVRLVPVEGTAAPVDAWEVLQALRAKAGADVAQRASLNHLLTVTRHIVVTPFDEPSFATPRSSYGQPGWGGRAPVAWLGAAPARRDDLGVRRPVVAVLDTGCGQHPWLPDSIVDRAPTVDGTPQGQLIGMPADATEVTGVVDDPLEGDLDAAAGHGTFIAGLIRQICPDANILAVHVADGGGAVAEDALLEALGRLVCRQQRAVNGAPELLVDVVSLSMGYYDEQAGTGTFPTRLQAGLEALGRLGTAVVVSAGNDATTRPMYPAALTPHPGGHIDVPDHDCVPVMSVGATNPDGTVALFSNAGDWVACHRPGAGLVSTFPTTFDASAQASYAGHFANMSRATIDPDNFSSGFGTWSGTSFAAPILAGHLAQAMVDGGCGDLDAGDCASCVDRGWAAITAQVGTVRP